MSTDEGRLQSLPVERKRHKFEPAMDGSVCWHREPQSGRDAY